MLEPPIGIIPEIVVENARATILIMISPTTARYLTASIDDPREFYHELSLNPEETLAVYFGWNVRS